MIGGMRKIAILLVSMTVLAAGCGDSDSKTTSSGATGAAAGDTPVALPGKTENKGTKDLSGDAIEVVLDDFSISPTFIKIGTPGSTVTVTLKNAGSFPHTFTSPALNVNATLQPDETKAITVTLPQRGATEFHCTFHQQSNGMQGAFFFKDGDTVAGGSGANSTSSSSSEGNPYN